MGNKSFILWCVTVDNLSFGKYLPPSLQKLVLDGKPNPVNNQHKAGSIMIYISFLKFMYIIIEKLVIMLSWLSMYIVYR